MQDRRIARSSNYSIAHSATEGIAPRVILLAAWLEFGKPSSFSDLARLLRIGLLNGDIRVFRRINGFSHRRKWVGGSTALMNWHYILLNNFLINSFA